MVKRKPFSGDDVEKTIDLFIDLCLHMICHKFVDSAADI